MFHSKRDGTPMRYSEILRIVGSYVDRQHLTEIRLLEIDGGLILQGLVTQGDQIGERATYQLTTEDIDELLRDAFALRGKKI